MIYEAIINFSTSLKMIIDITSLNSQVCHFPGDDIQIDISSFLHKVENKERERNRKCAAKPWIYILNTRT